MEANKGLVRQESNVLQVMAVDLTKNLPDLSKANELPVDLSGNYWTPESPGETKRLFFVEIKPQKVLSANGTGELIDLDCAVFLEQTATGISTVTNGSRRLVGVLESYVDAGQIKQGTPLQITYNGKKKNKSNGFQSDNWSIKPLIIQI